MSYAKILGTGGYIPQKIVTNQDLEKAVETTDQWIVQRTGIRRRHIIDEDRETVSFMAEQASRMALANAHISVDQLDMIIVGTCTADNTFPATACLLQKALGGSGFPAFDVAAACAGFIYALSIANQFIRSGQAKHVLVVGAEAMSRVVDWNDRATCVLFGDGAGAVVLGAADNPGIIATHLHADGQHADKLYAKRQYPSQSKTDQSNQMVHMDGRQVFKTAVNTLEEIVHETVTAHGFSPEQIDWLIPHQANIRIIQALSEKLAMPMSKVIVTVDEHANTSAASIPLALHQAVSDGKIKPGQLLLMEAFGAGLTWGSALVRY